MIIESKIDVRYPDIDPMGIVHHAVYPVWYEIARMGMFAAIGFSYSDMRALGVNPPMVNLNLNYNSMVTYPGTVCIRTRIISYAPKKLELFYQVFFGDSGKPAADAKSFHIWTGPDNKSIDMQANFPDVYNRIANACQPI